MPRWIEAGWFPVAHVAAGHLRIEQQDARVDLLAERGRELIAVRKTRDLGPAVASFRRRPPAGESGRRQVFDAAADLQAFAWHRRDIRKLIAIATEWHPTPIHQHQHAASGAERREHL